jgi:multidrug resistance efflux pump
MTASPNPRKRPAPFRVVPPASPPATGEPNPAPPTSSEAEQSTPAAPTAEPKPRRWPWRALLIGGGLVLLGFVPTPYQVGGEVVLAWPEGDRQQVRAPMRAIVAEVYVEPGAEVAVGDPLVRLTSRELDNEIAALEADIAQAQQLLAEAQREQVQAEANVLQAAALADTSDRRADRLQTRSAQVAQGEWTPEIEALMAARDRLLLQQEQTQADWQDYQYLYSQGAVAQEDVEEREALYLNAQRDLKANQAQIEAAQQQLADSAVDEGGNAQVQQASLQAANQVAASTERVEAQQGAIALQKSRLAELQQQRANLTLTADQAGTVLDDDLDLKRDQEVTPETPLLRIARLDQLTANVQVKEEELTYFSEGAEVTFRPTSAKLNPYDAVVDKILYDVAPDATQQRRLATVRVVIDNSDQQLLPGSGGYAKIFSEWIPLYQRLGREILKLVPSRFL